MSILKRYWSTLRRLRVLHVLNNIVHYGKLKQNKPLYRKFGVGKSVVGSLAHKDIKTPSQEKPWLDQDGAVEKLKNNLRLSSFPKQWQEEVLFWPDRGYMILKTFADAATCDKINSELKQHVESGELEMDYTNTRIMNAWKKSDTVNTLIHEKMLNDFLSFTLGREVLPFQTISFFKGSN
ncbi:MAG TPA: hypothetical protein VFJ43_04060, partial [Bacteroidia bacterium]|nr:hypothetical protein [Bacteroidia bacterium]